MTSSCPASSASAAPTPATHAASRRSAPALLLLLLALALPGSPVRADDDLTLRAAARATVETEPNFDDEAGGDADADDPAIWVHPRQPQHSLVLGTLKNGGLAVYTLDGATVQRLPAPTAPGADDAPGRFNNVDIVEGFRLGGARVDLAVVTDRGRDTLRIYRIDGRHAEGGPALTDVTDAGVPWVFSRTAAEVNAQTTAYGLAVRPAARGGAVAVVSQRERTRLAVLELHDTGRGTVGYRLRTSFALPDRFALKGGRDWTPCQDEDGALPQVEGMVFDLRTGALYAAQEQVGIWRIELDAPQRAQLVDRVRTFGVPYERIWDAEEEEYACAYASSGRALRQAGRNLSADAEGLTILEQDGERWLLASSQGDSTFVAYDLQRRHRVVGRFAIVDGPVVDGSEHSDGAAVTTRALGPRFPQGLLVVHDGENGPDVLDDDGEPRANTNFKFVPLQRLLRRD